MRRLFQPKSEAGFTLVEISFVMAITSAMLIIALAGQHGRRSQANFTASVDKVLASISEARNAAISGVNYGGGGTGVSPCPNTTGTAVFGGVLWTASATALTQNPSTTSVWVNNVQSIGTGTAAACADPAQTVSVGSPVALTLTATVAGVTAPPQVAFVRNGGDLNVCLVNDDSDVTADFVTPNVCTVGGQTDIQLQISDGEGHSQVVVIDASTGLAHR